MNYTPSRYARAARRTMRRKGISAEEVARACGCSAMTIRNWLRGKHSFGDKYLEIAVVFLREAPAKGKK